MGRQEVISFYNSKVARRRYVQQDGLCFHCGLPLDDTVTKEHLIPKSAYGIKGWANIVLAHYACNYEKGNRYPTKEEIEKFKRITGIYPQRYNKRRKTANADTASII